ncbi:MAG: DUF423 domain-containing protein [Chitinophagaceae bacterium]|jgi:uncharacterized membrane protein YgdD (TMEM256/DUF423 family)|nr:DUF423 domain-containing protein [Chitinophagaceae bacterium]
MGNQFLKISFLLAALAVGMGAFGAHALRELLDERSLQTYQTAVLYQFFHVFALALTGLLMKQNHNSWYKRAGYLFITGIVLFSGSLYTLTFLKAAAVEAVSWLGAVTPFGGVCFIVGWVGLLLGLRTSSVNE